MTERNWIQIPPEVYKSLPETGMGYVIVTITLRNGTVYPQAVIDSGFLTKIRGVDHIDFCYEDIASIKATHDRWDFRNE